jgi:hypothetical protein
MYCNKNEEPIFKTPSFLRVNLIILNYFYLYNLNILFIPSLEKLTIFV